MDDYSSLDILELIILAGRKDPEAMFELGNRYHEGKSLPKNDHLAFSWWHKSDKSDAQVNQKIGYAYWHGWGVEKNLEEAAKYFLHAAEAGDALSQLYIGHAYLSGEGVEKNYKKAAEWMKKAADKNDGIALWLMGNMYSQGLGVKCDPVEAAKCYEKAAQQELKEAQFEYAVCLLNGKGIEKNAPKAITMLQQLADQRYRPAISELADQYYKGENLPQSMARSFIFNSSILLATNENSDPSHAYMAKKVQQLIDEADIEPAPNDQTLPINGYLLKFPDKTKVIYAPQYVIT